MNKHKSNSIVGSKIDVRIPQTEIYPLKEIFKNYKYSKEICLKPNAKGSSIGVYLIKSEKDLKKALNELKNSFSPNTLFIIQPLISPAIEVSCGCLEKENGDFVELPPIEIIPKSSDFFDYKAKYTKNASIEITPPENISKEISERVSKLAVEIHKVLGCKVYSRSDFLIQDGDIYFLETNTLPGMTSTSLLPQEALAAGISFTELLDFFIENS
jgi:D-alanine-D-alanine ligase